MVDKLPKQDHKGTAAAQMVEAATGRGVSVRVRLGLAQSEKAADFVLGTAREPPRARFPRGRGSPIDRMQLQDPLDAYSAIPWAAQVAKDCPGARSAQPGRQSQLQVPRQPFDDQRDVVAGAWGDRPLEGPTPCRLKKASKSRLSQLASVWRLQIVRSRSTRAFPIPQPVKSGWIPSVS